MSLTLLFFVIAIRISRHKTDIFYVHLSKNYVCPSGNQTLITELANAKPEDYV